MKVFLGIIIGAGAMYWINKKIGIKPVPILPIHSNVPVANAIPSSAPAAIAGCQVVFKGV